MKLLFTYTQFQDSLIQGSYLRQNITRKKKKMKSIKIQIPNLCQDHIYIFIWNPNFRKYNYLIFYMFPMSKCVYNFMVC